MKKKFGRTSNTVALNSRLFDGCKTILRLSGLYSLIGVMIFSAGCNPSSTTINQNVQPPDAKTSQNETQLSGGTTGGAGDGGGGQGILCSEEVSDTNIKGKLLVRDIYEAIKNHKRTMPATNLAGAGKPEVDDAAINYLVKILKGYFGPASPNLEYVNIEYWKKFAQNISFISEDSNLHASQDANSPLALPNGCKIVQIAYWDESSGPTDEGTLYVDKKRWSQLDQFNKIALLAHEFFFKQARKSGHKNSDFVRYKVGQLFSSEGLAPVFHAWEPSENPRIKEVLPKSDVYNFCEGTIETDPSAKIHMYRYEGKDNNQHLVFPVLQSSTINLSALQSQHISYNKGGNESLEFTLNLLFPTTFSSYNLSNLYEKEISPELLTLNYRLAVNPIAWDDTDKIFAKSLSHKLSYPLGYSDFSWIMPSQKNTKPLIITIHNSVVRPSNEKEILKPKDELITQATTEIAKRILRTASAPKPSDNDDEDEYNGGSGMVWNAIKILHAEIDQMIVAGKYDTSFPKWKNELSKLDKKMPRKNTKKYYKDEVVQKNYLDDNKLASDLPKAIHALKSQSYTAEEIEILIKDSPYQNSNSKKTPKIKRGAVSIQQGEEKITFKLRCKDKIEVANNIPEPEVLGDDKKISLEEISFFVDQDSYKAVSKEEAEKSLAFAIESLKDKFADMNNNGEHRKVSFNCPDPFKNMWCPASAQIEYDLSREKEVTFSFCSGYQGIKLHEDYEYTQGCVVLTMAPSQRRYLVPLLKKSGKKPDPAPYSYGEHKSFDFVIRLP